MTEHDGHARSVDVDTVWLWVTALALMVAGYVVHLISSAGQQPVERRPTAGRRGDPCGQFDPRFGVGRRGVVLLHRKDAHAFFRR